MFKAVLLQLVATLVAALVAGLWVGTRGAVSVVMGGAAYVLPNLLFVVRLRVAASRGQASTATFFVGELVKILATILILAAAQKFYDVHWLALLVGLFVALKANLFAFLLKT